MRKLAFYFILLVAVVITVASASASEFEAPNNITVKEESRENLITLNYSGNEDLTTFKLESKDKSIAEVGFTLFMSNSKQIIASVNGNKEGTTKLFLKNTKTNKEILSITVKVVGKNDSVNDIIQFDSKMMKSVSSQIKEATDLTTTEDNRAVLAALLTLEYQAQEPDNTVDPSLPIYVAKYGTMASVSFSTTKGYVLVIYQMNPLSTYYSIADSSDPQLALKALEMSSEEVWEVPYEKYLEKLTALVNQLQ